MKNIQEVKWECYHCEYPINDQKKAWSRHGYHWCSKTCMLRDIREVKLLKEVEKAMK